MSTADETQNSAAPAAATEGTPGGEAPAGETAAPGGGEQPGVPTGSLATDGGDGKSLATDGGGEEGKGEEGAPESYGDFEVPDGIELNTEVLGEFTGIAKDMGLDQKAAQQMVDFGSKLVQQTQAAMAQQMAQQSIDWREQVQSDKDIGGARLRTEVMPNMALSIDTFGNAEFRKMLDSTQVGNHPEMVRFLNNLGGKLKEGGFVNGDSNTQPEDTELSVKLYGG